MSGLEPHGPELAVLAAVLASFGWRALGVVFANRIDPDGPVFRWFTCCSYAILAGLLTRLLVLPIGDLSEVGLSIRLGAAALGVAAFFASGRNLLIGVLVATGAFAAAVAWL
ncbi:MAG: AzlD domain-containing protein [Alphaproteobacteria bacterium]|nr:AzlD domain-containing protein [Alphaproteobacteria bacterium]